MKVLLVVIVSAAVSPVWNTDVDFNISLELQGDCSAQLTLICRHSDNGNDPQWMHNDTTLESGDVLGTAFPGALYTVQALTEHTATITGLDTVRALDGYLIQCAYTILGNLIKSNAVKFSFIPPDYRPALSLVSFTADFSERFCTFNYYYQESCSLYPRCTPYFSVEHTVSPQSVVSNSSSGCGVEYVIHNLMRCVSYQSNATILIGSQRGNPVVMGDTVMQSPGQFTIISVSIGVDRNLINVTYMEYESDCPGYPTERYTVDVDGVQVADLTADAVQSLAINHTNDPVTLSLPLSQPLPENAVTLSMTKYNTVPTNRTDDTGNIVTEMVTWGTSAMFDLSQESSAVTNDEGEWPVGGGVGAIISVTTIVVVITIAVTSVIARKRKAKKRGIFDLEATDDTSNEVQPQGQCGCGSTPAAASQGLQPVKDTNEHPVPMTVKVESEAVTEGEAPVSVAEMGEEGSNTTTKEDVVSHEVVEPPPPSPAAETADETLEVCKPEREYHPVTESTKEPEVALKRGNPAGGVEPPKTTCAFRDDPSTGLDYISGDKDIPQGQRTTQDLTYVTVDHSQRRPINVPNENLDVQYTGVKFDAKAPAV